MTLNKFLLPASLVALALAALTGCADDRTVYHSEISISEPGWRYRDTLDFTFAIQDTSTTYTIFVDFDHQRAYPFQNVYLNVHTRFPDGKRVHRVLPFDLFDPLGKPQGECSGNECRTRIDLQQKAIFAQPGTYTITLEQFTRRDTLPGLKAIALWVERVEE